MNFEKYHTYLVECEPALSRAAEYESAMAINNENAKRWSESKGGKALVLHRGGFINGVITDDGKESLGFGWKRHEHQPDTGEVWWGFNYRTKAGLAIEREINRADLRLATTQGLACAIVRKNYDRFGGPAVGGGSHFYESHAWQEAGNFFLIVPRDGEKPAPNIEGCRLIKLSEFYALKEAAEAKKAEVAA